MTDFETVLLQRIRALAATQPRVLVAIDGRCAAGKTTLAASLQAQLECNVFHMDDFFLRPEQRTSERLHQSGGNVDYERFLTEVLRPLHDGQAVTCRPYDCHTQQLHAPVRAEVRAVSIIEGSYSCHPALWDLYDLHVFLSVGLEEQRRRIAARSGEKMLPMFTNVWIPMEETYFAQFRVAERADLSREHGIGLVNCQTKCNRKQVQSPTSPEQNGN
ncbi:MAG: uridine kinase [Oscillospiraceae bacterium]|nr:hypothetical protein [Oscillospiraceae bacterium]